jgi:farnesyl-diphosphate farnesyltransferase
MAFGMAEFVVKDMG